MYGTEMYDFFNRSSLSCPDQVCVGIDVDPITGWIILPDADSGCQMKYHFTTVTQLLEVCNAGYITLHQLQGQTSQAS
jgi:hypothetical protein